MSISRRCVRRMRGITVHSSHFIGGIRRVEAMTPIPLGSTFACDRDWAHGSLIPRNNFTAFDSLPD